MYDKRFRFHWWASSTALGFSKLRTELTKLINDVSLIRPGTSKNLFAVESFNIAFGAIIKKKTILKIKHCDDYNILYNHETHGTKIFG